MGRAAWSVHAYHVHGFRNRARKLISNSRCDICEREYSTTTRLQAHLCYSKTCYRKLMAGGHALEFLQPGKNNTREQKAPEFPVPPLPSEGAKEASLCIEDPGEEEYFDQPVLESVLDELLLLPATASMQDCVEAIVRAMGGAECSYKDALSTIGYGARCMEDEEIFNAGWAFDHGLALEAMQYVHRHCSLTWFLNAEQLTVEPDDHQFRSAAWQFCASQTRTYRWQRKHYIPRFGSRVVVFLHLFSGERRFQDIQFYLERITPPEGCVLRVLSADVIFSASADLANEENQRKWIHFALSGCIIACYAGPPCESWSKARSRGGIAGEARGDDNGPRAIRTAAMPRSWSSQRS